MEMIFGESVSVKKHAPAEFRPGAVGAIVMIITQKMRKGEYYNKFPLGTIYSIEFEDGRAIDIHEMFLEKLHDS
jgi:hypothetical protein